MLRFSQPLVAIDSEDGDTSQRALSQNTLVGATAAINGLTSPSRLPPLTQDGSPSAKERKEDEVTADMPQAEVVPRKGDYAAIKHRLEQESQEQQNAAQVTPSAFCRGDELTQDLNVRFRIVDTNADAKMADACDKGRESTPMTETTGGKPQQQQDGERHHNQQQQEAPPTVEDTD